VVGDGAAVIGHAIERIGTSGRPLGPRGYPPQMRRGLLTVVPSVVTVLALALAGCGGDGRDEGPFGYDDTTPPEVEDAGVVDPDYPLAVHDISFASGEHRVQAFLVVPPGDGPWPAAVYVHGAGSDRLSMLGPATWLAARGAVTLALSMPSAAAEPPSGGTNVDRLEAHRAIEVGDVVVARRAIDLLAARDDVDPDRIAYVGWSAGARTGALLAGVEPRLHSLVLIAPGSAPVSQFVAAAAEEDKAAVREIMSSIDPLAAIARAEPERLLIQEAERDLVIPRTAIDAFLAAAPDGAEVRWYATDHAMGPAAYEEHLDWLQERLGIDGEPVPGAQTGPEGTT
jgi:dienelactone hydrolase